MNGCRCAAIRLWWWVRTWTAGTWVKERTTTGKDAWSRGSACASSKNSVRFATFAIEQVLLRSSACRALFGLSAAWQVLDPCLDAMCAS